MTEIKIGGRTIPLSYTTYEMVAIQDEIGCTAFQLRDEVFGIHLEDEDDPSSLRFGMVTDPDKTKKFGQLVAILGNAGLEEKGEKPDLTAKWILRHMKPAELLAFGVAVMAEIRAGNTPEKVEDDSSKGPVDEGLEEINAKKQPGN